jgi:2-oxoglutarate ferredoxin oxidoreductase subunit alpha
VKKIKYLSTGNEACAEGAVRAGCRFYAGYPITPQNEITAYMARRMQEVGGVFIQAESEIAAANMVYGASAAGGRALTSSSSPGISLKQECISYMAACELPAVIVNVMRGGPGLGNIGPSQSDYFQATKGGGHGDYRMVVLAPAGVQEMFDFTYNAFAIAEKYRIPVMILTDGIIGQMMEPLEFDGSAVPPPPVRKDWALTGAKGRKSRSLKSLILGTGEKSLEEHNKHLQEKYRTIEKAEIKCELHHAEDAEVVIVAYGTMGRIARNCVDEIRGEGARVGLIRPVSLWPFPYGEIKKLARKKTKFLVVEMSAGQMVEDVRLAAEDDSRVHFYGRMGGGIPEEKVILSRIKEMLRRKK